MTPKDILPHPAASVWPMLAEPDLRRLADDIATNGLRHPIVLDKDGQILDGRNRYAACQIAGVEPTFETYDGDDPVSYILSANNERRHLSLPQRAAATALTLAQAGRRKDGRWMRGSVPEQPDSGRSSSSGWVKAISEAGLVLDHCPELLPKVAAGSEALDSAVNKAQGIKRDKDQRKELPGDLGALVDAGELSMGEALRRAALPPEYRDRVASGSLILAEAEHLCSKDTQERNAAIARDVSDLLTWNAVHPIARNHRGNPRRQAVLDAMDDYDREMFLKLEDETWPAKK